MALIEYDLFGNVRDKVERAKEIARSFCPPEGYYLAYSGGKDSTVVKAVLDMAGVKYDAHYNVTTVDPPELVRFIINQFEAVIYEMPDGTRKHYRVKPQGTKLLHRVDPVDVEGLETIFFTIPKITMRKLIPKKQYPPTQKIRYCCEVLKESNGGGSDSRYWCQMGGKPEQEGKPRRGGCLGITTDQREEGSRSERRKDKDEQAR